MFLIITLGFQNCGPSQGFSSVEYATNSSLSSTLPNTPPDIPQLPEGVKPCGDSLAPGETCAIGVQFSPTTKGNHVGSLQIMADGKVVGEVALSGRAE